MINQDDYLFEEFCHLCDKLVAISQFRGPQLRNKTRLYICSWCDQGDPSYWKRPAKQPMLTNVADIEKQLADAKNTIDLLYSSLAAIKGKV